jgi:hypothetical protein
MLWTNFPVQEGIVEGHIDESGTWERVNSDRNRLVVLMGDPTSGPLVTLSDIDPGDPRNTPSRLRRLKLKALSILPEQVQQILRAMVSQRLTHHHRTDTFRMQVKDDPEQCIIFGSKRYGFGDFRLQPGMIRYREWSSHGGCLELEFYADRRGEPPIEDDVWAIDDESVVRSRSAGGTFLSQVHHFHTRDEDVIPGTLAYTATASVPRTGLTGSIDDDGWAVLSDGSKVAALFMGVPRTGPMVVLSHNTPGAVEAPAGTYPTEMLRLILKGTCSIGDRSFGPGSWRVTDANVTQGPVVHGPEGSMQLLFLADRRGWLPTTAGDSAGELVPRMSEQASVLGRFVQSAVPGRRL